MSNKVSITQTTVDPVSGMPVAVPVEIDSNRLNVQAESNFRWANALAMPSRAVATDALLWVLTVATPIRLIDSLILTSLMPPLMGYGILAALFAYPLFMTWTVWQGRRGLRAAILYRVLLTVAGLAIATIGTGIFL